MKCGYVLAMGDGYLENAIHVERDDELWVYPDDQSAARAAEADGVKLIYGMKDIPDGVYIDTPENWAIIAQQLKSS